MISGFLIKQIYLKMELLLSSEKKGMWIVKGDKYDLKPDCGNGCPTIYIKTANYKLHSKKSF